MKKVLLILMCSYICIPSANLFAQSDSCRWAIGIYGSPDYADKVSVSSEQPGGDFNNSFEIARLAFTAGVTVQRKLSNKFFVESGVYLKSRGYQWDLSQFTFGDMIDPRYGIVYPTQSEKEIHFENFGYNYISVPVLIDVQFRKKKFIFSAGIGPSFDYLVGAYSNSNNSGRKSYFDYPDYKAHFNYFTISGNGFVNASYCFSRKISAGLQPSFSYSFTELYHDATVHEHFYSLGIGITAAYHLK